MSAFDKRDLFYIGVMCVVIAGFLLGVWLVDRQGP